MTTVIRLIAQLLIGQVASGSVKGAAVGCVAGPIVLVIGVFAWRFYGDMGREFFAGALIVAIIGGPLVGAVFGAKLGPPARADRKTIAIGDPVRFRFYSEVVPITLMALPFLVIGFFAIVRSADTAPPQPNPDPVPAWVGPTVFICIEAVGALLLLTGLRAIVLDGPRIVVRRLIWRRDYGVDDIEWHDYRRYPDRSRSDGAMIGTLRFRVKGKTNAYRCDTLPEQTEACDAWVARHLDGL